ncbi:MAG: NAD(P)-dependent oxidoreductase [Gammaproteobacteria bacterium]|nr:MAG: NAD(P)-dependent oxidoreductase [Gammaproteobacteria bacterium]
MGVTIGFIGFGEAGYYIAKGLHAEGAPEISAYDLGHSDSRRRAAIEARAADAGVVLVDSVAELARRSEIIVSTVVSSVAVTVAREAAPHLNERHFYMDLNSTSPAVKQEAASVVGASGARFVEAAVMAGVPPLGHKVPMLLCGEAAPGLIARLSAYGMELEDFGPEIGRATATKMFRSIVVKGLEALFLECVLAASRYGVSERVLEYVGTGYPGIDWNKLAHYLIGRTAIHGERRAHEMTEVAKTLSAMGIEPIMADAAARRISSFAELGLKSRFGDSAPESYHEVIRVAREAEKQGETS